MDLREGISRYVLSRRWARTTLRLNSYTLEQFADSCGVDRVEEIDVTACERWWATQAHVCAGTARTRRSTVANFLRWCRHVGLMDGEPMTAIPVPREPQRAPVTLTHDEVRRVIAAAVDSRDRAVVLLMVGVGLRCCDVVGLEVGDVDLVRATVRVHGKGGRVDVLPVPSEVVGAVGAYLAHHPAGPGMPLIRDGRWHRHPITAQRLSEHLAAVMRRAGVKRGRHDGRGAHSLRRTCLTDLLAGGATIRQVQQVARHASLATTQRYLALEDCEALRGVVERPICA